MRNAVRAHVVVSSDTFGSFPVPYFLTLQNVEHRHPTVSTSATTRMNTRPRKPQRHQLCVDTAHSDTSATVTPAPQRPCRHLPDISFQIEVAA